MSRLACPDATEEARQAFSSLGTAFAKPIQRHCSLDQKMFRGLGRRHDPAAITRLGLMLDHVCWYQDPWQCAPDPDVDCRTQPTRIVESTSFEPHAVRQRLRKIVYPSAAIRTEVADHDATRFRHASLRLQCAPCDLQLRCGNDSSHAKRTTRLDSTRRAVADIRHIRLARDLVANRATKAASGMLHSEPPRLEQV
jgi:hypothetical protein